MRQDRITSRPGWLIDFEAFRRERKIVYLQKWLASRKWPREVVASSQPNGNDVA